MTILGVILLAALLSIIVAVIAYARGWRSWYWRAIDNANEAFDRMVEWGSGESEKVRHD